MNKKIIIKNSVIVVVILTMIFLSQWSYFRDTVKNFNFPLFKRNDSYSSKANDWLKENVYSNIGGLKDRISGGLQEKEELLTNEIVDQKNKIEESFWNGTKKYIAGKVLQTLNVQPQDLQQCQLQK